MWRKVAVLLFLLVVAQSVAALPIVEKAVLESSTHIQSAQSAQASQYADWSEDVNYLENVTLSEKTNSAKSNKHSRTEQETAPYFGHDIGHDIEHGVDYGIDQDIDHKSSEDLFNLPQLNRLSPLLFAAEIQTSPNYVLVIEFFKIKLTAGLYKHLANPPVVTLWFEQLPHSGNLSRLSGWKDGNSLYSSRITYHS
jgi:hypothetical protein